MRAGACLGWKLRREEHSRLKEGGPNVQPFHLRDKKVGFTGLTSQIWRIKGLAHRELHI